MDYTLQELIEPRLLQGLLDEIHRTFGISCGVIASDSSIIAASEWQDICTKFHRIHPDSELECIKSDRYAFDHVDEATSSILYQCPRGMTSTATPIFIEGKHLANFLVGQLFVEPPDLERFKRQAQEFGFNEDEYLLAVQKVPIFNETLLSEHMSLIGFFVRLLVQVGLQRAKVLEMADKFKQADRDLRGPTDDVGLVLIRSFERSISAISKLVELRDPYTAGHQRQVRDWACAIAFRVGINTRDLSAAALIHDVGKVYVPIEILTKPGTLSLAEFDILKEHPSYGLDIAREIGLPESVQTMINQHHERLDGSGYPLGIKQDEIILESRILAVADVVDAITSDRPYRPAHPIEVAVDELTMNRGIKYDATVVDACLGLIKEYGSDPPPFVE